MPADGVVSTEIDMLRLASSMLLLTRSLEQQIRVRSGNDGLTLTELGVLSQVNRGVDAPSQIARAMRLDPARITHLTDRLVSHEYLERSIDAEDRRRWRLQLTGSGAERLAAGREDVRTTMEQLLANLTAQELAALMGGLEGVRRTLAGLPEPG